MLQSMDCKESDTTEQLNCYFLKNEEERTLVLKELTNQENRKIEITMLSAIKAT